MIYNFEAKSSYSVTIKVEDGYGRSDNRRGDDQSHGRERAGNRAGNRALQRDGPPRTLVRQPDGRNRDHRRRTPFTEPVILCGIDDFGGYGTTSTAVQLSHGPVPGSVNCSCLRLRIAWVSTSVAAPAR